MNKSCKYILKQLRTLTDKSDVRFCDDASLNEERAQFVLFDETVNNDPKTISYKKYAHEIESVLECLINNGYITECGISGVWRLTQKGLHPREFGWEKVKMFCVKSILVPIAVALVTTILIHSIQGWL